MMDIDELKGALNWQGVYQGRDCLVIQFVEGKAGLIQGLRKNDQTFYLDYPEYRNHLISFLVTRNGGTEMHQYWVLGDRLHRAGGPAKVYSDTQRKASKVEWYQNGILHNPNGPAVVHIHGHSVTTPVHPRTEDNIGDEYTIEEFDGMEMQWWINGQESKYPMPHSARLDNGHQCYRMSSGTPVLSDFKGNAAIEAGEVWINWNQESSLLEDDPFRIRHLRLRDYERSFIDGVEKGHKCASINAATWIMQGQIQETTGDQLNSLNRELFSAWDIWKGPFFQNAQEQMLAMGELSR